MRFAIHFAQYGPSSAFDHGTGPAGTLWLAVALEEMGSQVLVVT